MKTETKTKESRLEFFRDLYESARNASAHLLSAHERNMAQYRGSREIDGSEEEALTVRNITYEIVAPVTST